MTTEPSHPYNDITGRREIREDLRSALRYPIRPDIYSIQFIETLHQRLAEAKIPERIQHIPEASPDVLGVILKEWKV